MVATPRAVLRNLLAALLAAGLMVLAAAMVTPGGDVARGRGPAIHPAAEITPNALPRDDDAHHAHAHDSDGDDGDDGDGARPAPGDGTVVAVVAESVLPGGDDTRSDRVPDGYAHPAASAPVSTVDGRAPPEPGAV